MTENIETTDFNILEEKIILDYYSNVTNVIYIISFILVKVVVIVMMNL